MKNIKIKKYALVLLVPFTIAVSSCDSMFSESCVYKGYVKAENEFHHIEEIGVPKQSEMNLMIFPLTGEGLTEYNNLAVPFDNKGIATDNLHVGKYEFVAYNKGSNILNVGNKAEDITLTQPTEDGVITNILFPVYSSHIQGMIVHEDTLKLKMQSECLVQKIIFNVKIEDLPSSIKVDKVSAMLAGVTTSRNIYDGKKGSTYASLPVSIDEKLSEVSFTKEVYVFGINTGVSNIMNMTLSGDSSYKTSVDLSDVFKNAVSNVIVVDVKIKFKGTLESTEASIESWKELDEGHIIITY